MGMTPYDKVKAKTNYQQAHQDKWMNKENEFTMQPRNLDHNINQIIK